MKTNISKWEKRCLIAQRIFLKKLFLLFGPINKLLQPLEVYCITKGYHHSAKAIDFDDTSNTDEWQKEVYLYAKKILEEKRYESVIDVGCGSAYKLIHYLGLYKTIGIEVGHTFNWLNKNYPERLWLRFDDLDPSGLQCDLVVCADVIEHLKDPDELLEFIREINCKEIMISTPERAAIAGKNDYGPPENPSHYREWNAEEFKKYLSKYFLIEEQRIFSGKSVTQVIIGKKYIV